MGANKNGQRIMCSVICTPPVEPAARRGWGIKALEIQKDTRKGVFFRMGQAGLEPATKRL